jgi:hypothetical protein
MGYFINFIAIIAILFISLKGLGLVLLCTGLNVLAYHVVGPNFLWLGIPAGLGALGYYIWDVMH